MCLHDENRSLNCGMTRTLSYTCILGSGTINMYSVFGSFKKVLLSGVQAPEMLLVLHSLQVRPRFLEVAVQWW